MRALTWREEYLLEELGEEVMEGNYVEICMEEEMEYMELKKLGWVRHEGDILLRTCRGSMALRINWAMKYNLELEEA